MMLLDLAVAYRAALERGDYQSAREIRLDICVREALGAGDSLEATRSLTGNEDILIFEIV